MGNETTCNNRSGGMDRELLERYREPAWNFRVIRFLDAGGRDIIPRKDRVWTTRGGDRRRVQTREALKRPVPDYLEGLAGTE